MMLHVDYFAAYASHDPGVQVMRRYVDEQEVSSANLSQVTRIAEFSHQQGSL